MFIALYSTTKLLQTLEYDVNRFDVGVSPLAISDKVNNTFESCTNTNVT